MAPLPILEAELFDAPPPAAQAFLAPLQQRFGESLAAVVFYGSCLRKQTAEGVLDFYALVDDYDAAYAGRALALANRALPPNVFYLETNHGDATLRAKVAVMSRAHFREALSGRWIRPGFWARFCQPARAVWLRDATARQELLDAVTTATHTALAVGRAQRDGSDSDPEAFWQGLFRATYACELRPESQDAIATLYRAAPERYDALLAAAATQPPSAPPRLARRRAKLVGIAALLKTAFTFGDWLPYALWKLERHTGTKLEPTERQRKHPLIFAWPLIFRVLVKRELR